MPTEKKIQTVKDLAEVLSRGTVVIGADYRGLAVSEITALRTQLRDAGMEMHVIKNTLFKRAADEIGKSNMVDLASGPTALVVGFGDPLAPVKLVVEYQRNARNAFVARSAYLDGQVITGSGLNDLATLPPKEVMIAELAGLLDSPIVSFIGLIQATIQEFSGLIEARAGQLEGVA